uniref:Uncharacterized protein n=1 Tax=Vitis vinifera TaxID=29760 RepID=A5C5G4_VITVI|nr:hypothetical protein VITISV_019306 [Vitis vinifera]
MGMDEDHACMRTDEWVEGSEFRKRKYGMKDEYGNGCEKVGSGYEDGEINGFRKMRKWYEGWVVREMRIDGLERWKLWQ